ncbi:hypothetical protein O0L34_g17689 [Tuta absoluta]|nr:hypothetical protein O0L34_g17689 [Tuta absoluta]
MFTVCPIGLASPTSAPLRSQVAFVAGTPGGRLASWIVESGGPLDVANRDLGQAQLSVQQLQRLLDSIELSQHHHDTDVSSPGVVKSRSHLDVANRDLGLAQLSVQQLQRLLDSIELSQHHHDTDQLSLEGTSPNVKKDRRKFGLRKKKSNSKCASVELTVDASASHTALSALTAPPSPGGGASSAPNSAASLPIACAAARPQSLPGAEALGTSIGGPASLASLTPDQQLREDFTVLAKDLVTTLKGVVSTLVCERGRLRAAMDTEHPGGGGGGGGGGPVVAALRTNLTAALQQNSVFPTELRARLGRIHDASDPRDLAAPAHALPVSTAPSRHPPVPYSVQ